MNSLDHEKDCDCAMCRETALSEQRKKHPKKADRRELDRRLAGLIADAGIARSQIGKGDYIGAEHSINEVAAQFARTVEQAIDTFEQIPDAERLRYASDEPAEMRP